MWIQQERGKGRGSLVEMSYRGELRKKCEHVGVQGKGAKMYSHGRLSGVMVNCPIDIFIVNVGYLRRLHTAEIAPL